MAIFETASLVDPNNRMFLGPRQAKRLPGILLSTLVHVLLILVAFWTVLLVLLWAYGSLEEGEKFLRGNLGLVIPFALMIPGLWAWLTYYEKRSLRTIGLTATRAFSKYLLGFILGLVMLAATIGFMALSGNVTLQTEATQADGPVAVGGILIWLLGYIIQGGTEEVITRGWYLGVLGVRYRPWFGVIASSVLFSVLHLTKNPIALMNLLLFGLFLAFYCLHEGSIWGVCGWHSAWNLAQGKIFGVSVSGHSVSGTTLFDLRPVGHDVLSGGRFGPEGSIYATVVFLAGIVVILMLSRAATVDRDSLRV